MEMEKKSGGDLYFYYYAACMAGGAISCGITHAILTPIDLVKCNIQANPSKFKKLGLGKGLKKVLEKHGVAGLFKGWIPTLVGYGLQGTFKFGLYEFLKHKLHECNCNWGGPKLYLAASAASEMLADIALCPFESVKLTVQTHPHMALGFSQAFSRILSTQGIHGFYKGLMPLWGRQIPYTMVKFACFESTAELLYKKVVKLPKESCSKATQLGVSFAAGYAAGLACALVSHPADNLISLLTTSSSSCCSIRDAIMKVGLLGLCTRGLCLRILMVGTQTGIQWALYDAFKTLVSMPSSSSSSSSAAAAAAAPLLLCPGEVANAPVEAHTQ